MELITPDAFSSQRASSCSSAGRKKDPRLVTRSRIRDERRKFRRNWNMSRLLAAEQRKWWPEGFSGFTRRCLILGGWEPPACRGILPRFKFVASFSPSGPGQTLFPVPAPGARRALVTCKSRLGLFPLHHPHSFMEWFVVH